MSQKDLDREAQLQNIVRGYRAVASGHLRLLSLESLRERLGKKWEARADHIGFIAESVIKRHLHRGQTFYQANDSTYVVVFDFDAEERAEFVCRAISREIVARLLGASENKPDDMAIEMRVAVVSCDEARSSQNVAQSFERVLANAPLEIVSSSSDSGTENVALPGQESHLVHPVVKDAIGQGTSPLFTALERQLVALENLGSGVVDSRRVLAEASDEHDCLFHYAPLWNARARAFLAARIEMRVRLAGTGWLDTDNLPDWTEAPEVVRLLDRLVLTQGLLDLRRSLESGRKYIAVIPVHIESFSTEANRSHILGLLHRQSEPIPRLTVIEVVNPSHAKGQDVVRHIWSMRDQTRRVILHQPLGKLPWFQADHLPDRGVGFATRLPPVVNSERQIAADMNTFVRTACKHNIETYVYGIKTRSLAFAAIGAGFDHIAGAIVAPARPEPGGVAPAPMDMLFSYDK